MRDTLRSTSTVSLDLEAVQTNLELEDLVGSVTQLGKRSSDRALLHAVLGSSDGSNLSRGLQEKMNKKKKCQPR
jgi:hypothetical protein